MSRVAAVLAATVFIAGVGGIETQAEAKGLGSLDNRRDSGSSALARTQIDCGKLALGANGRGRIPNPANLVEINPFNYSKQAILTSFQNKIPVRCQRQVTKRTRQIVIYDAGLRPNRVVSASINRTFDTRLWQAIETQRVTSDREEWSNPERDIFVRDIVTLSNGEVSTWCGVRIVNALSDNERGQGRTLTPTVCDSIGRDPSLLAIRRAVGPLVN